MTIVYYEGEFLPEQEAKFPVTDRGLHFGDGVYATIQVRNGVPIFLELHLEQLRTQCAAFNLEMPALDYTQISQLIEKNEAKEGIWRLKILVTGGDGSAYHLPRRNGRVLMLLQPFTPMPFKPLKMGLFPIPYSTCHASFKSLAHLNRFYVMQSAYDEGLDDAVTQTEKGCLLEAAFGNLFWVKEKTVLTPDPILPLYFGVTVRNILKLAQEWGFEILYGIFTLDQMPEGACAFRTNTMQGIRPIAQIGEKQIPLNPVVQELFLHGYEELIHSQLKFPLLQQVEPAEP